MRIMGSSARAGISLDFGAELWAPLDDHPAYEWVAARYRKLGRPVDDSAIRHYLTRNLLRNVIHAAGAIEYTVERIQSQLADAQALVDAQVQPLQPGETPPESGRGFAHPVVEDLGYEFMNLLGWAKALEDRINDRQSRTRRGLLPSLDQRTTLARRVKELTQELRANALDSATRDLANFADHASAIPYPHFGAKLTDDNRVFVPIPDPPPVRVEIFDQLTYEQNRDLASFAQELLDRVATFIDDLLDAFEEAACRRRLAPRF